MTDSQRQRPAAPEVVTTAARWVAWHAGELAAVGLPVVAALLVSVWLWALVVLVAGLWAAHEIRAARRRAVLAAERGQIGPGRHGQSQQHSKHEQDHDQGQDASAWQVRHG